ncbi:hypothetical protein GWK48_09475 [Metallosphaera tengchongensis]|uniref:Uncharacterized protein n=1 Tax=Metallosphaera tengchongensis TaxID=1532350 RepID=A0A6N0NYY3_9CREN|nr:hypothetical protein [Metallosphaera tengchongensis]QKR00578.1 hypothetical protein GWK48_09475 [Metallosphaera tengchongensis]
MSSAEIKSTDEFVNRLKSAIYMISVLAYLLNGEDREDAIIIRKMMKELYNKISKNSITTIEFNDLYGAILLGLSILYSEIKEELKRDQVLRIQETLAVN